MTKSFWAMILRHRIERALTDSERSKALGMVTALSTATPGLATASIAFEYVSETRTAIVVIRYVSSAGGERELMEHRQFCAKRLREVRSAMARDGALSIMFGREPRKLRVEYAIEV